MKWEYHKKRYFSEYDKYVWPAHLIARCGKCGHEENADDWMLKGEPKWCTECGAMNENKIKQS